MSWEHSDLFSMVTAIVREEHSIGQVPKLHPHGFIQLDLSGRDRRLHIWDDDIPRTADPNTLHDHVWDFHSTVLCGSISNHIFDAKFNSAGTWKLWQCSDERHEGERGGKKLIENNRPVYVTRLGSFTYNAGESYEFPAFTYHDSEGHGYTATFFKKTAIREGNPHVLCFDDRRPDGEIPASVTPEFMWEKIFQLEGV